MHWKVCAAPYITYLSFRQCSRKCAVFVECTCVLPSPKCIVLQKSTCLYSRLNPKPYDLLRVYLALAALCFNCPFITFVNNMLRRLQVQKEAIQAVEQDGMVFIDEIDKIVTSSDSRYGMLCPLSPSTLSFVSPCSKCTMRWTVTTS